MLKLVKTKEAKQPSTIYFRAAAQLNHDRETPAAVMADVLGCSVGTAATLRSFYNTCDGDPVKMQEKANESSRRSKAKVA